MSDFPDDPPTSPAAPLVTCPACHGEGEILRLAETAIGYRAHRETCGVCRGRLVVDREAYERARRATPAT